ncbi:MAG TPA: PASTA domain-containing protein [Terriglobales bacterium]|nr:PASTA domain-containing protein [Terriglobales bacterium]
MRRFFGFVLRALVLLLVALISALATMRFAIHGRELLTPNLVGKTPAEARRVAEGRGLQFEIERQYYSASIPEGEILSQLPPAGTQVRRGWQVRAAESLGPQRVQIPSALGESERAAEMNIKRRGLDVGAVAEVALPGATSDEVISQSPPPNASGVSAPKINLLVSLPPPPQAFVMPSFVGQPLASARLVLQTAGLRMGTVTVAPAPGSPSSAQTSTQPPAIIAPAGIILEQNPFAGQEVTVGSPVNFQVRQQ